MFEPNNLPYQDPKTSRRVAYVTGANGGAGYYIALHLYMHGWVVYMGCRSEERASRAKADIEKEANERKESLPSNAVFGELRLTSIDMARLESVEEAAQWLLKNESALDLLINNAGVMAVPAETTEDGFDIQLQTNHLSPFLLTHRLLPLLKQSPNGPRVVFVSSIGYLLSSLTKEDSLSQNFNKFPDVFWTWVRYGNSKVAEIHASKIFAAKHPDILTMSVHPGVSAETELARWWNNLPYLGPSFKFIFKNVVGKLVGCTAEDLSHPPLRAGVDPSLTIEKDNGGFLADHGKETALWNCASNTKYCQNTWDWTIKTLNDKGHKIDEE